MRIALLLLVCLPWTASAQMPQQGSWAQVQSIPNQTRIRVDRFQARSLEGAFLSASNDALSLRTKSDEESVPLTSVQKVSIRKGRLSGHVVWKGAAIGAAVGALMGYAASRGDTWFGPAVVVPVCAVMLGVTGAAVGLIPVHHQTVYSAHQSTP